MERLKDPAWIKDLYSAEKLEHFDWGGLRVEAFSVKPTSLHHLSPHRYRLLFFDPSDNPILSTDLESDILGDLILVIRCSTSTFVHERFPTAPSYERFKALSITAADSLLSDIVRQTDTETGVRPFCIRRPGR